MDDLVPIITCRRCGQQKAPYKEDGHLCEACVKAENNRVSYYRQHNFNWVDVAKEAELELWERQPAETDHEYHIWLVYRDTYPSKKPTYRGVAEQVGTTINVVKKIGLRWHFPTRMQAWAKRCDELTLKQRTEEIVGMNQKHITMAQKLNEKLLTAIESIKPHDIEVKDIKGLLQISSELERKARMHDMELFKPSIVEDGNPDLRKVATKTEDLKDVIEILAKAGMLTNVGIRQTTTTEVVVKE